jgi:hypothetical protein
VLDSGETIVIPGNLASTPLSSHHNIDDGQVRRPPIHFVFAVVVAVFVQSSVGMPKYVHEKEKEKHPGRVENRKKIDSKWKGRIYIHQREREK